MIDQSEQNAQRIAEEIIARCWADEAFKQRLLVDLVGTLKAEGLMLPEDLSAEELENTVQAIRIAIPARPTDLADAQLASAAAGGMEPLPGVDPFSSIRIGASGSSLT